MQSMLSTNVYRTLHRSKNEKNLCMIVYDDLCVFTEQALSGPTRTRHRRYKSVASVSGQARDIITSKTGADLGSGSKFDMGGVDCMLIRYVACNYLLFMAKFSKSTR
jgi:hypothetical protein